MNNNLDQDRGFIVIAMGICALFGVMLGVVLGFWIAS